MTDSKEGTPVENVNQESAAQEETPQTSPKKTPEEASPTEALEAELKSTKEKYSYLAAEFENFKKRTSRERQDTLKFGWEPLARDLLQVVDNFERALDHAPEGTDENLIMGLKMIRDQFLETLKRQGVEPVKTVASKFDPNFHEAVAQEEASHPEGHISQEHLKGFTLHGRLLRPAQVVVSTGSKEDEKAPAEPESEQAQENKVVKTKG